MLSESQGGKAATPIDFARSTRVMMGMLALVVSTRTSCKSPFSHYCCIILARSVRFDFSFLDSKGNDPFSEGWSFIQDGLMMKQASTAQRIYSRQLAGRVKKSRWPP